MISHKHLLSAPALITQSQPEDSATITRRAIEVARTALAIKHAAAHAELWIAVDFTPEYFATLDWEERIVGSGNAEIILNYFHRDVREVGRGLIFLGAAHLKILEVFDRCLDGWLRLTPSIWEAVSALISTGRRRNAEYERTYGIDRTPPIGSGS